MKIAPIIFLSSSLTLGFAGGALAQERMAPATIPDAPHTAAMASPSDMKVGAPATARTSITMSQAKAHIEKAGYTGVVDLVKTNDGLWQGQAMSHGQQVAVSVDPQGRVATR